MKDLSSETVLNLATRLNEINAERQKLDIEYNTIVHELWNRIPSLKDSADIQPKVLRKEKKDERPWEGNTTPFIFERRTY